jgi:hypothetical protein
MDTEDTSAITGVDGSVLVTCDAPGCPATVPGRPALVTWFDGRAQDPRRTPTSTSGVKSYCPKHAGLATA